MPNLRDVTREFGRGETALETLRAAARAEGVDRRLADDILRLIGEWEKGPSTGSAWSRNELRARAKQLIPPDAPAATEPPRRKDPTETMYAAGVRGQRRNG